MNWDIIEGKWDQAKGTIKQKWADLTDDEVAQMNGQRDRIAGTLREKYGWTKEQVERELTDLFKDEG